MGGDQVSIRTSALTDRTPAERTQLFEALAQQAGISPDDISAQDGRAHVGRSRSRDKALIGLVVVLFAITLYITLRFEWKMAVGAMVALVHDVLITVGVYALTGREVTPRDRHRDPDDPRVLAVRHRRDLRQGQGEHRVDRAARARTRVRRRRRTVAEPGADAVGEHVARGAAADPVAAAVRRRHAEGLRVRDARSASRPAPTRRSSSPRRSWRS